MIKVSNVMKVVDISSSDLNKEFIDWLINNGEPTYKDQIIKEHIYNWESLEEIEQYKPVPSSIRNICNSISRVCQDYEAGYFRIIYC